MFDLVADLAGLIVGAVVRKVVTSAVAEPSMQPPRRRPDATRVRATDRAYRQWADRHRLTLDEAGRCYRGTLARHAVVVSPGLGGSAPIGVEVEIAIDHGEPGDVLLRGTDEAKTEPEKALCKLLDDPALRADLRSVALLPRGVRMRFVALAAPRVVERAVADAVDGIASLARARGEAPYR